MRLGILPLGPLPDALAFAPLAAALRAEDVDVVAPDSLPTTAEGTVAEAERIARADCDGVLLLCPERLPASDLPLRCALPLAAYPLLLGGTFSPGFLAAAGALEAVGGLQIDRLPLLSGELGRETGRVRDWLAENERRERQRGVEAARRLHGERIALLGEPVAGRSVDAAGWLAQFGVFVSSLSERVIEARVARRASRGEDADATAVWYAAIIAVCAEESIDCAVFGGGRFLDRLEPGALRSHVPEGESGVDGIAGGDWEGALTHRLLRHVSPAKEARDVDVGEGVAVTGEASSPDFAHEEATFARVRRVAGRYSCDLFSGRVISSAQPRFDPDAAALAAALGAGRVHFLTGRHAGAVRAACHALDIDVRRIGTSS